MLKEVIFMDKTEAFIFILVIAIAVGGMYFIYSGTGEATRRMGVCEGGYTAQLTFSGLSQNYISEYKFRGLEGVIELVDIKENRAMFKVNNIITPYLALGESWIGDQIGIKVGKIDVRSVGVCLASAVPECVDYYWDIDTMQRECGQWASQADYMF